METIKDMFRFLNNPHHVWKFQQFFGLRKVSEVKTSEEGHWVALDSRSIPRPLPERVRIPTQPTITQSSFEREYRINQRVRAVRRQQSNEDDESRCSSGYSSEGEPEESASVLYYKIGRYFWCTMF
ncbi:uncharacterized protein LOC111698446 [Eurytemora carolleeae]|uniref:uncharacterized protein LOC111698446 n=1 Tax=Eurytemora carolleeae TaxID=1294199 RepID=UPI000C75C8D5|nr:uncharacterized protein LOC111698446 [Eurytemora carolleeae]|eukprot:XP_023324558.1 uncharacterized protein LOC111698446 [Eurytemora affinis]